MRRIFLTISSLLICSQQYAQEYFQQQVNYNIQVTLNDRTHELNASESMEYINNSHDELTFIYMHLWPNAYKDQHTALARQLAENGSTKMYFATDDDLGYIDQLDFKVNDQPVKTEYDPVHIDICKLILNEPLKPGQKINITTPFHVKLPSGKISRLGHVGQAYTITQWYPKPAVYDMQGWHQMPYLNQGEFYSEFGSFDVSITVPKNYVLGATGDMVDGAAELDWLNTKIKNTEKKIADYGASKNSSFVDHDMSFPESSEQIKTLRFKQSNVHDFAWFCDKRYNVLKGEVMMPYSKRTVTTWAMFTNEKFELWKDAIAYLNDATFFYSMWNGDYQYKHVTAVDGTISAGGGMEYPNITVIGTTDNEFALENVIMHEVGHNWFYGMLGSNERDHAWMDEGINSFNEMRYIRTKYPGATVGAMLGRDSTFKMFGLNRFKHKAQYELLYAYPAHLKKDQPCELPSQNFIELNYGGIVYSKTAILFDYLMNYMGEDDFDNAMQFYFDNWKFRHPQPNDLRRVLEYYSEKNLSWFFDDLIGSTKILDYKICKSKKLEDGNYQVIVKNVGAIKGPVALCGLKNGKIRGMVWYDGFDGKEALLFPPSEIDEFKIDYFGYMPEINRRNNIIRTNGIFKKMEPLKPEFIAALDDPNKTQLFWTPITGYNQYNKGMLGLAVYNHCLFQKKVELDLAPLYSFGTNTICGYGKIQGNIALGKNFIQQLSFGLKSARFAYGIDEKTKAPLNYTKMEPYLAIEFGKKNKRSPIAQQLAYRIVNVKKDFYQFVIGQWESGYFKNQSAYSIHDIRYTIENKGKINPFKILLNAQLSNGMNKVSITANYSITLKHKKFVDFRFFAGKMFDHYMNGDFRFRMSGQTGFQDYLYDNIYFGRSAASAPNLGFQQFTETDGAFKIGSILGQSDNWLSSLNVKSPKLFKLPLLVYADFGLYSTNITYITQSGTTKGISDPEFLYSGGIGLPLIKNIFEIYVPLVNSKNITDAINTNNPNTRFVDNIRFTLNLNLANPFNLIKSVVPL